MAQSTMIVLIVFIAVGLRLLYKTYCRHLDMQERMAASNASLDQHNSALHDKIATMEERIRVLEAIVTDSGYQVSKEIDSLK